MTVFEVLINGKLYRRVGLHHRGSLSAIVSMTQKDSDGQSSLGALSEDCAIQLGAFQRRGNVKEIVKWNERSLAAGDEVTIRVRALEDCDPPDSVETEDAVRERARKKSYLELLKRELGEA